MITLRDIKNAEEKISPFILKTPQIYSSSLSSNSKNVYLKLESMQITGSFKLRGAINKLLHLTEEQKSKGVIAVSTGNHGKGVAYAAQKLGIKSKIFIGKSKIEQHRLVYKALNGKMGNELHALALNTIER